MPGTDPLEDSFKISPYMKILHEVLQILEPDVRRRLQGIFAFKIIKKDGTEGVWTIDLTEETGAKVEFNSKIKPDVTFVVEERYWMNLIKAILNPQRLLLSGRVMMEGNVAAALKLSSFQVDVWETMEKFTSKL